MVVALIALDLIALDLIANQSEACLVQEVDDMTHDLHLLQRQYETLKGEHAALVRRTVSQSELPCSMANTSGQAHCWKL